MKLPNILREPLLYLLPLLALTGFLAIPAKSNISDVVLTVDGIPRHESFPVLTSRVGEHSYFQVSFKINVKDNKKSVYKFYPNDCILGIEINGNAFPQENIKDPCAKDGTMIDLSRYVREGLNRIEFQMGNIDGFGGLRLENPSSVGFRHILFFALLLMVSALVLRKFKLSDETVFACVLSFPFVVYAFVELCIRINYEFSGIYQSWDAPVYYAVGRGIANGIAPWSGLFEIKPLGIFLVSAISFKFFDSPVFTYYSQVFVLLLTVAVPVAAYFLLSGHRSVLKLAFSLLAGLLLALYSAERSGEFQVESFGAAFACVAVFAMAMPDFEKRRILWTSLATIGILGACGFKEPFLFPLLGVSLIFCKNIKEWASRFALPLAIAVSLGFVFLLICGWLGGFLHYLEFMSSTHISRFGSPFSRAMEFYRIYDNLSSFSRGFAIALLLFLSLPFLKFFQNIKENTLFVKVVFFCIAFFLSCFSVGLGGEFFEHHFVFALPFYMALVLLLLKNWDGENFSVTKLGLLCLVFLIMGTIDLPYRFERNPERNNIFYLSFDERTQYLNEATRTFEAVSAFLDRRMDDLGIDRYVFIGGHLPGIQLYGWTRHSPMGPYFFQPPIWSEIGVGDSLISNLKKADAVVLGNMEPMLDTAYIYSILEEQFTQEQTGIFFRKRKMEE